MQEQGMARRGGAAFIWKWGAISGVVLGVIQLEPGLGAGIGALGGLVGHRVDSAAICPVKYQ